MVCLAWLGLPLAWPGLGLVWARLPDLRKYAEILCRGCAGIPEGCIHSIPRMRRNTIKMHTFYTADVQEHNKNAYILYRGCAGGTQGDPGHPGGSRRSWEEKGDKTIVFYSRKRRDRPFRVQRRARPSPSTVNYSKNGRSYARTFSRTFHSPF